LSVVSELDAENWPGPALSANLVCMNEGAAINLVLKVSYI